MSCCGDSSGVTPLKINGREFSQNEEFTGPVKSRSCRDVICLLFFVAFCIFGIIYIIYAATQGNPERLIRGYDDYGNICGKENGKLFNLANSGKDMTNKKYYDVLTASCVTSCDATTTNPVVNRCFPKIPVHKTWVSKIQNTFQHFGENIRNCWGEIVAICFIALGFSIIGTLLLRFTAAIIVYGVLLIVALGSIAGTIALWVLWSKKTIKTEKDGFLVAAIFATIFTVIFLVVLIAMRNRIRLVIQLFVEASKAVAAMPFLLAQPLWTLLVLLVVLGVWVSAWIPIQSSGDFAKDGPDKVKLQMNAFISGMRVYHVFGFLWVTEFVLACQEVAIAGAVSTWYFSRDKSKLGWPIATSIGRLARYHVGSVAFGSLIIAIVQMIRLMLKYVEKRFAGGNSALKGCLCCVQCCLSCFERFLKFLSRNAYIEIAIYGESFCASAKKAFAILTSNALRVAALNFVANFVLLLFKVAIVAGTVLIGKLILETNKKIDSIVLPLILVGVIAYLIAYCFISVYQMTIDTLFLCFCEDCQMNDGIKNPYFMSKGLMKFVENSKKSIEALEYRKNAANNNNNNNVNAPSLYPQIQNIQMPPNYQQYPPSPYGSHVMPYQGVPNPGMTPLHPGYPPVSVPPTPSHFMAPPSN